MVELKNIALNPRYRGNGLGKIIVKKSFDLYYKEKGFRKMIVGTANSSIGYQAFY
ncbi:GNAT family N-acetyltransferase [Peribacillus glennii]|uniref:GNAT family N-acetyltransferase n=1 Tax=Peribacillus glennii TaxID=2303991 RepID=UPI0038998C2D